MDLVNKRRLTIFSEFESDNWIGYLFKIKSILNDQKERK
jgi:hypothetical protein